MTFREMAIRRWEKTWEHWIDIGEEWRFKRGSKGEAYFRKHYGRYEPEGGFDEEPAGGGYEDEDFSP